MASMIENTSTISNLPTCPFCPFADADGDFVAQHVEFCHPEGGTGSAADPLAMCDMTTEAHTIDQYSTSQRSKEDDDDTAKYVECPHGCGEVVAAAELSTHLDLHVAEGLALEDLGSESRSSRHMETHESDEMSAYPGAPGTSKAITGDSFLSKKERSWIAPRKTGRKRSSSNAGEMHAGDMRRLGVFDPQPIP